VPLFAEIYKFSKVNKIPLTACSFMFLEDGNKVKMRMLNKYLETKACRLIQGMRF
jgi:hypothetical protein